MATQKRLLAQHWQAPAKRWQHLNATVRNIDGCGKTRTWPKDYNIMQHPQMLRKICDDFQI